MKLYKNLKPSKTLAVALLIALTAAAAFAADWPSYRGPDYNGISKETPSISTWADGKPNILWKASTSNGFSSVTVSKGKLYTLGNNGKKGVDESKHKDIIYCLDATTGKEIWTYKYQCPLNPKYYEGGTSSTPTVAAGKVYTLSKNGKAFCLNAMNGELIWEKDFVKDFGLEIPTWGFAGSPVIIDDLVIYNAGSWGTALNKNLGKLVWQNGTGKSGYASPVPFTVDGKKAVAIFSQNAVSALIASSGKKIWTHRWSTKHDVNAADPIISGNKVFISSGYETGCSLFRVNNDRSTTELWKNKNLTCKMNGPILKNGHLYGIDETSKIKCVDFNTGELKWSKKGYGYGTLMLANDTFIVVSEKGKLALAKASPKGFNEIASGQIFSGKCWQTPVIANGKIYARNHKGVVVCVDASGGASTASAEKKNWPQWQGPDRTNISNEKGLLKSWPQDGPKLLWSAQGLGKGYSTVSIANGTIYVTGLKDDIEHLSAFDLKGNLKWQKPYGKAWTKSFPSARSTPTIDSGNAYVMTTLGTVVCLDAKTGKIKWSVDTKDKFGAKLGRWGGAESLLIEENMVICTPGGDNASLVALDKNNGSTIWTTKGLSEKNAYCSPIIVNRGNKKIVVTLVEKVFVGVDAKNGNVLWKYDCEKYMGDMRIRGNHPNTPIYKDGCVYVTSGYDMGGVKLKLSNDGTEVSHVWSDKNLDTHHGGVVLVDGFLYGSNWKSNDDGDWVCLDWETGKKKYQQKWKTKGSITYADGMLYCYEEKNGNIAIVKATPEGFDITSSFKVPLGEDQHWAHPVVFDGKLFIRHGDALMVYDIKHGQKRAIFF